MFGEQMLCLKQKTVFRERNPSEEVRVFFFGFLPLANKKQSMYTNAKNKTNV